MKAAFPLAILLSLSVAAVAAAAPQKPTTRPIKAEDTEGRFVGAKVVAKSYDPKTRTVSLTVAFANKANKDVSSFRGTLRFSAEVAKQQQPMKIVEGRGSNFTFEHTPDNPLNVGALTEKTFTFNVPEGDDKEEREELEATAKWFVLKGSVHWQPLTVTFADGTSREP